MVPAAQRADVPRGDIEVPTTFIAGKYDLLASAHDMGTAAARIPREEYHVLRGSHFIAMERPGEVHQWLLDLIVRLAQPS
jgi:pimeloyl-ACP methyl ester carboxylesterase